MFGNCKFRVLGTVFMVMLTMAGNIVKASEEDAAGQASGMRAFCRGSNGRR